MSLSLEELIYRTLTTDSSLINALASFNSIPAVFEGEAPIDTDQKWGATHDFQFPRIVYYSSIQEDPARFLMGNIFVDIYISSKSLTGPESIEGLVKTALHGTFFESLNGTESLSWIRSDPITDIDGFINGLHMTFNRIGFPSQEVYNPADAVTDSGVLTGGSTTTIVCSTKAYGINQWKFGSVSIVHGGTTYVRPVLSNTSTVITFASVGVTLIAGDTYIVTEVPLLPDPILALFDYLKVAIPSCYYIEGSPQLIDVWKPTAIKPAFYFRVDGLNVKQFSLSINLYQMNIALHIFAPLTQDRFKLMKHLVELLANARQFTMNNTLSFNLFGNIKLNAKADPYITGQINLTGEYYMSKYIEDLTIEKLNHIYWRRIFS
jgi:hypothetical protein